MTLDLSRLGISSIAWSPEDDGAVARLLIEIGITNIDLAPSKYAPWGSPDLLSVLEERLRFWNQFGIRIRGFQSLLFGTPPMNILQKEDWGSLLRHFERVFEAADLVGARKLVFGSPKSRLRGSMPPGLANQVAAEFFSNLADLIAGRDIQILIEPNPEIYGCDFVTTTEQAAELVANVARSEIKINLDLGTSLIQSEMLEGLIVDHSAAIGYVHLSTEGLKGLADVPNPKILDFLSFDSDFEYSIEQNQTERGLLSIQDSLKWLGLK